MQGNFWRRWGIIIAWQSHCLRYSSQPKPNDLTNDNLLVFVLSGEPYIFVENNGMADFWPRLTDWRKFPLLAETVDHSTAGSCR